MLKRIVSTVLSAAAIAIVTVAGASAQGMWGMPGMYGMRGMYGMPGMWGMRGMYGMPGMTAMYGMRGTYGMYGMPGMGMSVDQARKHHLSPRVNPSPRTWPIGLRQFRGRTDGDDASVVDCD